MSKDGDRVMRAQRQHKKDCKGLPNYKKCPICLQRESMGHDPFCSDRKKMHTPIGK